MRVVIKNLKGRSQGWSCGLCVEQEQTFGVPRKQVFKLNKRDLSNLHICPELPGEAAARNHCPVSPLASPESLTSVEARGDTGQ